MKAGTHASVLHICRIEVIYYLYVEIIRFTCVKVKHMICDLLNYNMHFLRINQEVHIYLSYYSFYVRMKKNL